MMKHKFKYKKFAETLYRALRNDAFYVTLEKSIKNYDSVKEAMLRYLDYSIIEGERYGELFIPENHAYGISIWAKPLNEALEKEKRQQSKGRDTEAVRSFKSIR